MVGTSSHLQRIDGEKGSENQGQDAEVSWDLMFHAHGFSHRALQA